MHDDMAVHAMGFDLLARQPYVLGIALDGVDHRLRRAFGKPQRGIAKRGTQFEHAPRIGGGGQRTKQRAVVIRVSTAAVLGAMRQRRLANGVKRVGRSLGHNKPFPIREGRIP